MNEFSRVLWTFLCLTRAEETLQRPRHAMGCKSSRPIAPVTPGLAQHPSVGAAATVRRHRRSRLAKIFGVTHRRGKRFNREQRQLIKKYLPSIPIFELSTPEHRDIAGQHWNDVYREGSASTTSKKSQGSWGREAKQTSALRELYDTFYAYLEEHFPDLMPVFRASMHVRGKVLVHISAGTRSILSSNDVVKKLVALTQTHLRVGVKLEYFDPLAKALLFAMEKTSGSYWTPEVEHAWKRLFVHCSALLMVEQKKAAAQPPSLAPTSDIFRRPMGLSIRERSSSGMQSKTSTGRHGDRDLSLGPIGCT